jgi:hypothetical protein
LITDLMREDHEAGREIFAVAGNSPFEATAEREAALSHLVRLWRAHGAMMEEAVLPALDGTFENPGALSDVRERQATVAELAADLARRADRSNDQDLGDPSLWYTDFERLKATFEEQCLIEAGTLIPLLQHDLAPERIGVLTRTARAVRLREGV